jgi:hypothetical protein
MSGPTEPRVALVSPEDQGSIMTLIDIQVDAIGYEELREAFTQTQEVLMGVEQYSQPISKLVFDHPQQIIDLLQQITYLQTKQFLPPQCDHTEFEHQLQTLWNGRDEARRRHSAPGTNEKLRQELADMTQDAQQSGEEAWSLRMQ